jgi:uncharacterized membrane protein (DUF2068 family)
MLFAAIRLSKAYGLWRNQVWAEVFAIQLGGLYLPVEKYEGAVSESVVNISIILADITIVGWLAWVHWEARKRSIG